MQRGPVDRIEVHAFDDVDLAAMRPVGSQRPEGGPCAAAEGHVVEAEEIESMCVCVARLETNGWTA